VRYSVITKVTVIGVGLGAVTGVLITYAFISATAVEPPRTPLMVVTRCALSGLANAVIAGVVFHLIARIHQRQRARRQ
jgi:uncharacterized membrane protein